MANAKIIEKLLANRIFRGLTPGQLEHVSKFVDIEYYSTGQYILHQGDIASEIYIIANGTVEIVKQVDNNEYRIATLVNCDCIGEIALFDNSPHSTRSASARALSPCEILVISAEDLRSLITDQSPFLTVFVNLAQELSLRIRRINDIAVDFLKYKFNDINMNEFAAGLKPPPLKCQDREEVFKEAMLFRELNKDAIVVCISDYAMEPFYKIDDYVGGRRCFGEQINRVHDKNCIIATVDDEILVRHFKINRQERKFELTPCNTAYGDDKQLIGIKRVKSVAEIIWHRSIISED